jgi:protein gp37
MHPEWARSLRDQCVAAAVPYHFKQWGEWGPTSTPSAAFLERARASRNWKEWENGVWSCLAGKRGAGRELDGRVWDEYPVVKEGA